MTENLPKSKDESSGIPEEYPNLKNDSVRFLWSWILQRVLLAPVFWFYTRVLNRTEFVGLENLEALQGRSFLLCANHTSSWDIWSAFEVGFKATSFFSREYYLCGLGAIERLGSPLIRYLTVSAGVLAVNRKKGLEQHAMQDLNRLYQEEKVKIACLIYPEGTRSKNGRLSKQFKAGAGWIQALHQVPVLPVYQINYDQLPGFGKKLKIVIGKPLEFPEFKAKAESPTTWIQVTSKIMDAIRSLEDIHNPLPKSQEELRPTPAALPEVSQVPVNRPQPDDFFHAVGLPVSVVPSLQWRKDLASANILAFAGLKRVDTSNFIQILQNLSLEIPSRNYGVEVLFQDSLSPSEWLQRFEALSEFCPNLLLRGFTSVTPEILLYRYRNPESKKLFVRVSLPDAAIAFASPPSPQMLELLTARGLLSEAEALHALTMPVATHILVDSTGELRDILSVFPWIQAKVSEQKPAVKLGICGGIGSPQAIKGARAMGADFVMSDSIHLLFEGSGLATFAREGLWKARIADFQKSVHPDWLRMGSKSEVLRFGNLYSKRAAFLYSLVETSLGVEDLSAEQLQGLLQACRESNIESAIGAAKDAIQSFMPELVNRVNSLNSDTILLLCTYALILCERDSASENPVEPRFALIRGGLEIPSFTLFLQTLKTDRPTNSVAAVRVLMKEAGF